MSARCSFFAAALVPLSQPVLDPNRFSLSEVILSLSRNYVRPRIVIDLTMRAISEGSDVMLTEVN